MLYGSRSTDLARIMVDPDKITARGFRYLRPSYNSPMIAVVFAPQYEPFVLRPDVSAAARPRAPVLSCLLAADEA